MLRTIILITIVLLSLLAIFSVDPIAQDLEYHRFADTRFFAGIPNFLDVFSNISFLLVGVVGLSAFARRSKYNISNSWGLFFLGVFLVGFGSSYYHINPNNSTLVWDRLPMTIGFMGLFVALLSEWITERLNILLIPMCLLGIGSVYYWYINDDLRFYAWIQFFPLIMIIIIRLLYTPQYSHQNWLLIGLGFYVLSKVCEHFDNQIFAITNSIISGHTIKHFTAAIATYCIYLMLKKRSET